MTHADAFLQDILAHPDDDAPRLIFADWLEEQGDAGSVARAEFIRAQCALTNKNLPPHRRMRRLVRL
ncbi:MAG: TIGR02996 domain-containing protein [Gemmataceae bacterium]